METLMEKTSDVANPAERLLGILNNATTALMISVGHRTGLFDTLRTLPPSTSTQIAQASGLNERYVREWCGALTMARILEYDAKTQTYRLPESYAAFMTRQDPANNMAVFMQYVSLMGSVEDSIVACFQKGGGVPYEAYTRFHDVMAEDSGQSVVPMVVDHILPLAPEIPRRRHRCAGRRLWTRTRDSPYGSRIPA
jgi:hypothetical protein